MENERGMNPTSSRNRSGYQVVTLCLAMLVTPLFADDGPAEDGSLSADPYIVYVAVDEAFARCGPAGDYYRTDALRRGQELEVYVETADGWLGIRPPADSFCWIPASSVNLSGNSDLATVLEDRTVAWIGTHLGRARRYRWQVQLAKGEPVTVLGKSERDGPDGPQLWYRIVPPSGEFRWVHREQIVESAEELVQRVVSLDEPPEDLDVVAEERTEIDKKVDEFLVPVAIEPRFSRYDQQPSNNDTEELKSSSRSSRRTSPKTTGSDSAFGSGLQARHELKQDWQTNDTRGSNSGATAIDQVSTTHSLGNESRPVAQVAFIGTPKLQTIGHSFESMTPADSELASDANWVGGAARRPTSASTSSNTNAFGEVQQASGISDSFAPARSSFPVVSAQSIARVQAEVTDANADKLQLLLSRVMAAGGSAQEAEPIAQAGEMLARMTTDSVEARRAQAVVDRTRQYQRVAARRDGDSVIQSNVKPQIPVTSPAQPPLGFLSPLSQPQSTAPLSAPPTAGETMTETGYLVQVYSARPNSPPFAITDNNGRTIAYVTPSPGTNLRMHLNNYIRVEGPRGYVNGLDTPHILATQTSRVAP